ncbi:hypothetical protein CORC01_10922 [Colletotrichum orchidophilum]|uniref:Uncharacterized protein n=1 Tax=Colletotrichum orchidophilum TaxID=1209926 RepID=A0A1G4AXF3_9PEZI|nr:uncharacterized protein CORC01_10922 [Colletotrichum orchidophilum]OHE93796.1 hypothetical protein CORC01_10922 [Colletotrichum orchidophilum]
MEASPATVQEPSSSVLFQLGPCNSRLVDQGPFISSRSPAEALGPVPGQRLEFIITRLHDLLRDIQKFSNGAEEIPLGPSKLLL